MVFCDIKEQKTKVSYINLFVIIYGFFIICSSFKVFGHDITVNNHSNYTLPLKVTKVDNTERAIFVSPWRRYRCKANNIENIFIDGKELTVLDSNYYGIKSVDFDINTDGKQWNVRQVIDRYGKNRNTNVSIVGR